MILKKIKQFSVILILLSSSLMFGKTIYVATNGSDANNGTINSPYRTLSKAISVLTAGDVCIIRGGVYEEPFVISKNGNSNNYITIKAMDGEKVDIRATKKINNWQLYQNDIYKTTVNMNIESRFRAVYHNEEFMDLARWPNNVDNNRWTVDCHPVTGGGSGNYITASGIPNINWANGGLMYYLGAPSGTSWTRAVSSSTTSRINHQQVDLNKWPFNTHNAETWRNYAGNERGQFYLFNKLEALDYFREWYYNAATSTLYLKTSNGAKPTDNSVEYAAAKFVAEIKGDYIKLEGLDFFGGSVKIHNNADNNIILNCKIIHGSEGYDELTNDSAQVGEAALEILGANTIVKGNTIDHSSVSGITIVNWSGAHNCVIEQNTISNTDYVGIHASPIRSSANNLKVLKNTIYNAGRDGMYVAGTNCEIAYNDVSASKKINSDSGIFYTVGNTSLKNNEIHHNWFHDATAPSYSHNQNDPAKAAGIYLDNDSKGYVVHHNVIWNVSWSAYQVNWNNINLNFYHNTIWNAERAMDSWDINGPQLNNKIYNNYSNVGSWFTGNGSNEFDIKDNVITTVATLQDPNNQNFMPIANAAVVDKGRIISGFTKPYKNNAPDIGAYEFGGTAWTAGINAIEDSGEPLSVDDIFLDNKLMIYPNPTSTTLNLKFTNDLNGLVDVKIFSVLGKQVITKNALNSIDVSALQAGTYFIKIKNANKVYNTVFVKK